MAARAMALLLLLGAAACGPPGATADGGTRCGDGPLSFTGTPGQPSGAEVFSNVFILPVKVGATSSRALIDTGAPITIFDPGALPSESLPSGQGPVAQFQAAGLTFSQASVVGAPLNLVLPSGRLAGIVGGDLLCHFATSFNYRDATVTLGEASPPARVGTSAQVPIEVQGGGVGSISLGTGSATVTIPPTRVAVTATLEGTAHAFVVDTGASYSVVTPAIFDALVKDGRKVIDMLGAQTVMGAIGTRVARSKSIVLGGLEVQGAVISALDSTLLTQLGREVGHPVDGLIGGNFLREFYVTVDYASGQLRLSRYDSRAHIADEFTRVGAALQEIPNHPAGTARYQVGRLFVGSDAAAKGLAVGTKVLKIDGTALELLAPTAADTLLLGPAGTTHTIQTDSATLTVAAEDLL